jgi:hypothetical protein
VVVDKRHTWRDLRVTRDRKNGCAHEVVARDRWRFGEVGGCDAP